MLDQVLVSLVIIGVGWLIISAVQSGIVNELRPAFATPKFLDRVRAGGWQVSASPERIAAEEWENEGGAVRESRG